VCCVGCLGLVLWFSGGWGHVGGLVLRYCCSGYVGDLFLFGGFFGRGFWCLLVGVFSFIIMG